MFAIARHLMVPASAFLLRKKGTEDVITNRHLDDRRGSNRSGPSELSCCPPLWASIPTPVFSFWAHAAVSLGSMIAASGIYLKARAIQPPRRLSGASVESKNSTRRVRGGCDVCHGDLPVIHCKVHQVHLCANCLGRHYDFRSCAYAPSTRGAGAKTAKAFPRLAASSLVDPRRLGWRVPLCTVSAQP